MSGRVQKGGQRGETAQHSQEEESSRGVKPRQTICNELEYPEHSKTMLINKDMIMASQLLTQILKTNAVKNT